MNLPTLIQHINIHSKRIGETYVKRYLEAGVETKASTSAGVKGDTFIKDDHPRASVGGA